MKDKKSIFSLGSFSTGRKLLIAFQLMFIFPFLVCLYLILNYILPESGYKINVIALVTISIFTALAGFLIIKNIFDRLTATVNHLTERIGSGMDELKQHKERISELSMENKKRSLEFSNLIQVSSLIVQGSEFIDLLKIIVEKVRLLAGSETAFLIFKEAGGDSLQMKIADGAGADYLMSVKVSADEGIYSRALNLNKLLILDKQNSLSDNLTVDFLEKFQLKNCLAIPVFLRGSVKAVLGIGNMRESFLYGKNDIELLNIFSKQIAIAIENNLLNRQHEVIR